MAQEKVDRCHCFNGQDIKAATPAVPVRCAVSGVEPAVLLAKADRILS